VGVEAWLEHRPHQRWPPCAVVRHRRAAKRAHGRSPAWVEMPSGLPVNVSGGFVSRRPGLELGTADSNRAPKRELTGIENSMDARLYSDAEAPPAT
jgi:hypothetical protein